MLLYELINTVLSEARRNPEKNVKNEGHQAAVTLLKSVPNRELYKYGVSMTDLPKLGINPGSRYNTPLGIYYYPAAYYVRKKGAGKELEFKDDAPYIQVFKINANTIERLDEINESTYAGYMKMLYKHIGQISTYIGKSEKETHGLIGKMITEAPTEAMNKTYGGQLWYILYSLGLYAGRDKRDNAPPRSSVVWNAMIRMLGLDGVEDDGLGIIHVNEPYQGVIVNPRAVEHITTIRNPQKTKINAMNNQLVNLSNMKVDDQYIENVVHYIRELDLVYDTKSRKYCKKIVDNILKILRSEPLRYRRLDIGDIRFILLLTTDFTVTQELIIGYYVAKFPKIKEEVDQVLNEWAEVSSGDKWATTDDKWKKRLHGMTIPMLFFDRIKKIIRDLTPFNSNPNAGEILTYLNNALSKLDLTPEQIINFN